MTLMMTKSFMCWYWVIMRLKSLKHVLQFKELSLLMKRLWIRWNSNKWSNINKELLVKAREISIYHWQLHMDHHQRTHIYCKFLMNVLVWLLERKDKLSRSLLRDQVLKRCKSPQEVPLVQRRETSLLRVTLMQYKESESSLTQSLKLSERWQVVLQMVHMWWKSKSQQD